MKRSPLIFTGLLSVLTFLIITGCANKIVGLYQDESFNRQSLRSGKVGVGGVTSISGQPFGQEHQDEWADMLVKAVNGNVNDFHVLPSLMVKNVLGDSLYYSYLLSYRGDCQLEMYEIKELGQRLGDSLQFLIMSRLDKDEISHSISETEDTTKKVKKIYYNTRTTVWVTCSIYDLHAGKKVWHGLIKEKGERHNKYEESTQESGLLGSLLESILGSDDEEKREYPEAYSSIGVTEAAFNKFAKNLPGAKK